MTEEQRDEILINLQQGMNKMDQRMDGMDQRMDRMEQQLETQRMNMARMEDNLTDKIMSLYDAREVSLDKFKENDQNVSSIQDILEDHTYRISVLESNR